MTKSSYTRLARVRRASTLPLGDSADAKTVHAVVALDRAAGWSESGEVTQDQAPSVDDLAVLG